MKFEIFWPVKPSRINQGFGVNGEWYRQNGINIAGHNGLDFFAYHGQPIKAAHDGEVVYAGMDAKEGVGVVLRTNELREYKDQEVYFKTIYWHLIKNIPVKVGQKVKVGEVIGYADNTGFSTGDHLHFGLKPQLKGENDWTWVNLEQDNGYMGAINPAEFCNGVYAEDALNVINEIPIIHKKINWLMELISKIFKGRK